MLSGIYGILVVMATNLGYGVYSDSVEAVRLYEIVYPRLELISHPLVVLIQVR